MSAHPLPDEDVADLPAFQEPSAVPVEPLDLGVLVPPIPPAQVATAPPPAPFSPPTQPLPEHKKPTFSLAPIKYAAPVQKSPNPKDAINSLLGELTMVGKLGTHRVRICHDMDPGEGKGCRGEAGSGHRRGTLKRPARPKVAAKVVNQAS